MKLSARTFQIFWDVHAWVSILAALLIFVMFFLGAFALFFDEINGWANPGTSAAQAARGQSLTPLLAQLAHEEGVVTADRVAFIPHPAGMRAYVRQGDTFHDFRLVPELARLERSRSELGTFLFSMHYFRPIPGGMYVAGVASMALLLALLTGFFIHLKDLARQWLQFRPERTRRTWSSDLHKVLGIFGLPYQLMYAWSGAVLCLAYVTVEPAFTTTVFGGDEHAQSVARGELPLTVPKPTGKLSRQLPDLDALLARSRREIPGLLPTWIGIEPFGDESASVTVYGDVPGVAFGSAKVVLGAYDGSVRGVQRPETASSLGRFEAWFYGLHYAHFGGYGVKLLYALLALTTCAVIVTGNLIWLERRDRARVSAANRWLEQLTVMVCAGVVVATSAMFASNRLLAGTLTNQASVESVIFWCAWALAGIICSTALPNRRSAGILLLTSSGLWLATLGMELRSGLARLEAPLYRGVDSGIAFLAVACALGGALCLRERTPARRALRKGKAELLDTPLSGCSVRAEQLRLRAEAAANSKLSSRSLD